MIIYNNKNDNKYTGVDYGNVNYMWCNMYLINEEEVWIFIRYNNVCFSKEFIFFDLMINKLVHSKYIIWLVKWNGSISIFIEFILIMGLMLLVDLLQELGFVCE